MRILFLITALFLTSCSATQHLSVYSFNNADIESILQNQLPQLRQKLTVLGLPVDLQVDELQVDIGPDNRDVVQLSLGSTANIRALMLNYPVSLDLTIEGSPYYDSKEQAVYLRDVNLLDSSIDAGGFKGNLGVLDKEVMTLVNRFLSRNPIYKLDPNDPAARLFNTLGLNAKIEPGKIKITPGK